MTDQTALPLHALRSPTLRRIDGAVLIACSSSKLSAPAPARELYTGDLFRRSVRYAEAAGLPWAVLSALHGLVLPDDTVAPYDFSMKDMTETGRAVWGMRCVLDLFRRLGHPYRAVILAPQDYREPVEAQLRARGVPVIDSPLAKLGIGRQRKRLAEMIEEAMSQQPAANSGGAA